MSTRLIILIFLLSIISSCQQKTKSRFEARFERYANENFYDSKDFNGFASIEPIDSFDIAWIGSNTILLSDSIQALLGKEIYTFEQLVTGHHVSISQISKVRSIILECIDVIKRYENLTNEKLRLSQLIQSIDSNKTKTRIYSLKVKIKGKTELANYYAADCALLDSIIISNESISIGELPDTLRQYMLIIDAITKNTIDSKKALQEISKFNVTIQEDSRRLIKSKSQAPPHFHERTPLVDYIY